MSSDRYIAPFQRFVDAFGVEPVLGPPEDPVWGDCTVEVTAGLADGEALTLVFNELTGWVFVLWTLHGRELVRLDRRGLSELFVLEEQGATSLVINTVGASGDPLLRVQVFPEVRFEEFVP